jgi:AraC-like DNA-binding protein
MYMGKQKLRLTKGTITLSPAGKQTSYHVDDPAGGWHYTVCFSAKISPQPKDHFSFAVPLYRPPTGFAAHESRLREIITLFGRGKKSELAAFAASNALLQLLLRISLYSHYTGPEDDGISTLEKKLLALENYIEVQLEHALPAGDLATYCDLSPDYLAQMFKKKHGVPLQRYILNRRIEKAQHLLETTSISIKEIGCQVGFPDPQYFNKRFRTIVGRSPSAYRAHIEN